MSLSQEVEAFLRQPNICVLATTGADGSPHAMPMWYVFRDGDILFAAGLKSQKVRNIERTGRATVVVDQREKPYYAVMLPGTATIEAGLSEADSLALFSRYLEGDELRRYVANSKGGDSVAIRVRPERFVEFHGRAGT
ncbi:MAG: TIGR03618 family F420-dependent PPOX class oxidoreductase [Pseudomonadota bacterium]|nr:TIGR03618 family F420-dependent PPOX class oxidoreductase [Pseudomonadota bacterium]